MYLGLDRWVNGGVCFHSQHFRCDRCHAEIPESLPRVEYRAVDLDYCWECAFIIGELAESEFLTYMPYPPGAHPYVEDGKIKLWWGKVPPWKRTSRRRKSPEYTAWRKEVFSRDDYTCQKCGVRGGFLEAHHIKPYKDFPKLRTVVSNGITYCKSCHVLEHKGGRSG